MDMNYVLSTEQVGEQTKIKSSTTATGNDIIFKAMMVFMKGTLIDQEDKNLAALKKVVEAS